jgi:hypothetical protein
MKKPKNVRRKRSGVEIIQRAAERQARGVRFTAPKRSGGGFPKPKVTVRRGFSRR